MFYQQGDVKMHVLDSLPKNLNKEKRSKRGYILAEGEVTGHAHVIDTEIEFYRDNEGKLFFRTEKEVTVKHEEHRPVTVPPGCYRVGIVQEYDYDEMQARNAFD